MKILISNDDGYRSEGIRQLAAALAAVPQVTVTVMAPERNRSGASNSLTLDVPLRVTQAEPGVYFVAGTPTDCVHLAISGFFDLEHDIVVSGVNDGANSRRRRAVFGHRGGGHRGALPRASCHRDFPVHAGRAAGRTLIPAHRWARG